MKKSIIILTVSAFYLISCRGDADDHSHSEGHKYDGHDHNHHNEQENFVVVPDSMSVDNSTPNVPSKSDPAPSSEIPVEHIHEGHHDNGHSHDDNK